MITVASYNNPADAQIAKGLLESNGIQCMLKNENLVATLPIGSIELMVDEQQFDQAKEILESVDPEMNED